MNIEQLIPNKPKQKRSLERYEKILDTVEKILLRDGVHAVSIQEVSKVANMKRPTLYKLFPSNEALFHGLSERHMENFNSLYRKNTETSAIKEVEWYFNLFIDLVSIYLNQNKACAALFFYLDSFPTYKGTSLQNKRFLATTVFEILSKKNIKISVDRVYIASQLCLSTLAISFNEENFISPRYVTEGKKAVNAYLATN
ncbi:uncharacterized protein METZ01_LOCUS63170 [marine metagenome]|uniref:HTH tetR-type domain-containing protein n=1 Tax=marine metagenome TaxID=408172 RepID=A0A381T297_9ZZZZ